MAQNNNSDNNSPPQVYRFVLTGGPCGGKTTALARLSVFLRQRGFRVYTVPEAAELLMTNGASFTDLKTLDEKIAFQIAIIKTQIHLEDTFYNIALSRKSPSVLLCDRGTMDGKAYIPEAAWREVLESIDMNQINLRDARYNGVFHLMTAADGAEKSYTRNNNLIRSETPEQARAQDVKTRQTWIGHPKLYIFDNKNDFEHKMQRVISVMSKAIGLPVTQKHYRRFLLKSPFNPESINARYESFFVEKVYISRPQEKAGLNSYSFIRKRQQSGLATYGQTTVNETNDNKTIEMKRIINGRDYDLLKSNYKDPTRSIIQQTRYTFLEDKQYFEINDIIKPVSDMTLLNVQMDDENDVNNWPEWIKSLIVKDVTEDSAFGSYHISKT